MLDLRNKDLFIIAAVVIVSIAFILRLEGIIIQPLTVDEATIAGFARGVVVSGYPFLMVGGMEVELATYELVPYFLAASIKIWGYSDFALRFPALCFGTACCALIIYSGTVWFNRSVALFAGVLYAFSPWAIYWSQNAFHPAQTQFFSLLAIIAFKSLIESDQLSLKTGTLSALAFSATYLSWEGTGLLLPTVALVAFYMRWGQWKWFLQPSMWVTGMLIVFTIALQAVRRLLLQDPYIMVGSGKSDMTGPKLTFTDPSYDAWYYIENFFLIENHVLLSLVFILGFFFINKDKSLTFVMIFVVMAYLTLTNLLSYYNAHYIYFVLPIFYLAVSAIFIYLIGFVSKLYSELLIPSQLMSLQGQTILVLATLLFLLPVSGSGFQLYRLLTNKVDQHRIDYRPGLAGVDAKSTSLYMQRYMRESDVVISTVPLVTEHYTGNKGDFFLQTITDRKVVYDTEKQHAHYVDKFVGNPVLRSKEELMEVFDRHSRVWFLASPTAGMNRIIDTETLAYIEEHMEVVNESYDGRLYLWEK